MVQFCSKYLFLFEILKVLCLIYGSNQWTIFNEGEDQIQSIWMKGIKKKRFYLNTNIHALVWPQRYKSGSRPVAPRMIAPHLLTSSTPATPPGLRIL